MSLWFLSTASETCNRVSIDVYTGGIIFLEPQIELPEIGFVSHIISIIFVTEFRTHTKVKIPFN